MYYNKLKYQIRGCDMIVNETQAKRPNNTEITIHVGHHMDFNNE